MPCNGSVILFVRKGASNTVLWFRESGYCKSSINSDFVLILQDLTFSVSISILYTEMEVNQRMKLLPLSPANDYLLDLDLSILNSQLFFLSTHNQEDLDGSMQISCWHSGKINTRFTSLGQIGKEKFEHTQ